MYILVLYEWVEEFEHDRIYVAAYHDRQAAAKWGAEWRREKSKRHYLILDTEGREGRQFMVYP